MPKSAPSRKNWFAPVLVLAIASGSCGDDSDDSGADAGRPPRDAGDSGAPGHERDAAPLPPPPEAPSDLEASIVAGGAHLIWQDNSDDELRFVIERKEDDEDFEIRATPMTDETVFHDAGLVEGVVYAYRVMAVGANNNRSAYSNVVTISLP
jgi:hypothetical protein